MIPGAARTKGASLRPSPRRLALILCAVVVGLVGALDSISGAVIKAKAFAAQLLLEDAWDRTLAGETQTKPWPWADVWPVLKIEAPRLQKSAITLSGVSGQAMAFGPGLMDETPTPGDPGMSIIAAHRDTHFKFLKNIAIGDDILITRPDGNILRFVVAETRIVNAIRSGLYVDGATPQIALVTCWPFDAALRGDERFVVIATLEGWAERTRVVNQKSTARPLRSQSP